MLNIDPTAYRQNFNQRHFLVQHELASHPLFEIPRLLELAQEVSRKWPGDLHYDRGITNIGQRWDEKGEAVLPIDETIRNIETAGAWIDLKSAEQSPPYRKLLDTCISDLLAISGEQLRRKMRRTQLAIFITSPRRISTYHIDSETNFLLQVRGTKQISLFSKDDREVLPEQEIEKSWSVDTNAAVYKPHLQDHADVVTLAPGIGVHIPVNAPHWVQNGSEISVSAAILYHSYDTSYANLYAANYLLRKRLGIEPTPPFKSKLRDAVKQPLGAAFIATRRALHGRLRPY